MSLTSYRAAPPRAIRVLAQPKSRFFSRVLAQPKSRFFSRVLAQPKSRFFSRVLAQPKSRFFSRVLAAPKSRSFSDPDFSEAKMPLEGGPLFRLGPECVNEKIFLLNILLSEALASGACYRFILAFCRPGSDLLSRVLRRSTIGAGAFHGRVRNGNGCGHPAITTRSAKGKILHPPRCKTDMRSW